MGVCLNVRCWSCDQVRVSLRIVSTPFFLLGFDHIHKRGGEDRKLKELKIEMFFKAKL